MVQKGNAYSEKKNLRKMCLNLCVLKFAKEPIAKIKKEIFRYA